MTVNTTMFSYLDESVKSKVTLGTHRKVSDMGKGIEEVHARFLLHPWLEREPSKHWTTHAKELQFVFVRMMCAQSWINIQADN